MVKYWLNFIHNSDPNVDFMTETDLNRYSGNEDGMEYLSYKLPEWKSASVGDGWHLYISDMSLLKSDPKQLLLPSISHPKADKCYFWDHTLNMINEATLSVDTAYFQYQEDMRRWRQAMEDYHSLMAVYNDQQ